MIGSRGAAPVRQVFIGQEGHDRRHPTGQAAYHHRRQPLCRSAVAELTVMIVAPTHYGPGTEPRQHGSMRNCGHLLTQSVLHWLAARGNIPVAVGVLLYAELGE